MEGEICKQLFEPNEKIIQLFKEFMARVTKLEEFGNIGSRLFLGFRQGLENLSRPPIDTKSYLINSILKANRSKRLASYLEAGCIKTHDAKESLKKLHISLCGLKDHIVKVKSIVDELEELLEDVIATIETRDEYHSPILDKEWDNEFDHEVSTDEDETTSSGFQEPRLTDYAILIGIIYSMVKQDYLMQEKIVTSLSLKSKSEELDSYALMWSLHPFVNDEVMHQAWKLIP